jgi:lysophospholipase L1-like esterase
MTRFIASVTAGMCLLASGVEAGERENLLTNGQLSVNADSGGVTGWVADKEPKRADKANVPPDAKGCLRVDIKTQSKQHGFIYQHVNAPKDKRPPAYVLSGKLKSSAKGIAFLQVKLFSGKKRIKIFNAGSSATTWREVRRIFAAGKEVDRVQVLCRYRRDAANVGQSVWFADVSLEASDEVVPSQTILPVLDSSKTLRILVLGDSTVCTFPADSKLRGWGQMLDGSFKDHVGVISLAQSGRSSKSFITEGRLDGALAVKAQYALIQFGHNDSHAKTEPKATDANTDFKKYLRVYIDSFRKKGVEPVLVTPVRRRTFRADGALRDNLAPYAKAMKEVAAEQKVPVVDLHAASGALFLKLGDAGSADLNWSEKDRTHFSEKGARIMARLVLAGLVRIDHPLCAALKADVLADLKRQQAGQ